MKDNCRLRHMPSLTPGWRRFSEKYIEVLSLIHSCTDSSSLLHIHSHTHTRAHTQTHILKPLSPEMTGGQKAFPQCQRVTLHWSCYRKYSIYGNKVLMIFWMHPLIYTMLHLILIFLKSFFILPIIL